MLRDTFDSIIPAENLRELLKRDQAHSRLQLLRKKGVLSSFHWSKLYPATPTEVSSASFDIPLLIVLLRTICNLSPPPAGWDTPPLTADTSRESDIARIKYYMNAVSKHAAEGSFSDLEFNSYWQQIRDILVRLGGADYGVVINEMKDQDIEFLDGEHFKELLKQWKKVEDDIKEKLNEMETEDAFKEEGMLYRRPFAAQGSFQDAILNYWRLNWICQFLGYKRGKTLCINEKRRWIQEFFHTFETLLILQTFQHL